MRTRKGRIAVLSALAALAAVVALPSLSPGAATLLHAKLKGSQEVPGPGDADAKGGIDVSLKAKKKKVCFTLEYRKLDGGAVAGHIHKGKKGVAGAIKVELFEVDPPLSEEGSFEACQKNVKRKLIRKIKRRPENYYVNIHTPPYPEGAIRGQLKPDQGI
jgi:CHRD domain